MIPQYSIQEWHEQVPWNTDAMVEQDLRLVSVTLKRYWNVIVSTWSPTRGVSISV